MHWEEELGGKKRCSRVSPSFSDSLTPKEQRGMTSTICFFIKKMIPLQCILFLYWNFMKNEQEVSRSLKLVGYAFFSLLRHPGGFILKPSEWMNQLWKVTGFVCSCFFPIYFYFALRDSSFGWGYSGFPVYGTYICTHKYRVIYTLFSHSYTTVLTGW